MPRTSRLDCPGTLHHVIGRGIEKKPIFFTDDDRHDFLDRLEELCFEGGLDVYAWALIPNHFHLLCKTRNRPLSDNMRRLLTGYAINFNKRHDRHGHLFQNRYKSIVCQEEAYLKQLVRYIHLNPLRAELVQGLDELKRFPWSGHAALCGTVSRPWQDCDSILAIFGEKGLQRRRYLHFVARGVSQGRRPELVGGGLVRSLGGWSEVRSLQKRAEAQPHDQRILGDGDFVTSILRTSGELQKVNLRLDHRRIRLDELMERVCRQYRVSKGELKTGGRRRPVVRARSALAWLGVRECGYSGAEVARFLGVTTSCITRGLKSGVRPDVDSLLFDL